LSAWLAALAAAEQAVGDDAGGCAGANPLHPRPRLCRHGGVGRIEPFGGGIGAQRLPHPDSENLPAGGAI